MRVRELRITYSRRSDLPFVDGRKRLTCARDAVAILTPILEAEPVEVFVILCLSTKHQVIAYHEVSRGVLDATLVHPREVFKAVLVSNSAALVLAHNHPSGDPDPTSDDAVLTRRLVQAGELLGVDVLDHVILGHETYYSFKEHGRL